MTEDVFLVLQLVAAAQQNSVGKKKMLPDCQVTTEALRTTTVGVEQTGRTG